MGDQTLVKAEEYAELIASHGLTLESSDSMSMVELEKLGLTSLTLSDEEDKLLTTVLYRYTKETEEFHYVVEVFANRIFRGGMIMWFETRATIKVTIYDK